MSDRLKMIVIVLFTRKDKDQRTYGKRRWRMDSFHFAGSTEPFERENRWTDRVASGRSDPSVCCPTSDANCSADTDDANRCGTFSYSNNRRAFLDRIRLQSERDDERKRDERRSTYRIESVRKWSDHRQDAQRFASFPHSAGRASALNYHLSTGCPVVRRTDCSQGVAVEDQHPDIDFYQVWTN